MARRLSPRRSTCEYAAGAFTLHYFDHCFPVAPQSYVCFWNTGVTHSRLRLGENPEPLAEYDSILTAIRAFAAP